MFLHDPLLALRLRTGNGRDVLATAEQFARKYGVPVSIVAAAIGVFATGFAAAKVLEEERGLWMTGRLGRGELILPAA